MLTTNHYQTLTHESGISEDVIRARGYRSVTDAAELRALGFAAAQCRPPGLLLPLWTTDGQNGHYVFRPDVPRVIDEKKRGKLPDGTYQQRVIKYEQPQGTGVRVDCPPSCRPALADPTVPLFITEGQKKADALASRGACAVALLGVWNFKGRNDFGGTTLLADFDYIAFDNRAVYLVFDSDVMTKRHVRAALERLTEHLQRKRAAVHAVYLPRLDNGKTGVDDWLAATGKGIADLVALAEGPRPEPKAAPPVKVLLDEVPSRMTRPLALIDGRAYAAAWATVQTTHTETVNRRGEVVRHDPPLVEKEEVMVIMRDDGVIFGEGGDQSLADSGLDVSLPEMIPPELRLSPGALRAYREGYRPDPADVFRRVCECVDRFIDFDRSLADQQTMVEMVGCYIMATWFLDAFTVAGNLWPNGDRGSGKTQLLAVITKLAYLGQLVLAGGSFAALRDLADYGATLAFDDAENINDPRRVDPDKRTLLLAGNRRGNSVPVKERVENGWKLRYINTYSFRLFSAIQLPDSTLASRTIIVPLIRTPDRYRANADPTDPPLWPHKREKLVEDLWLMALAHLPELSAYEAEINRASELTGRNLEPWRALLSVAAWLSGRMKDEGGRMKGEGEVHPSSFSPQPSLLERMMALSVAYQSERPNVETGDLTALVIRALGMIVGKMVRDNCDTSDGLSTSDTNNLSDLINKPYFVKTELITGAAQMLVESHELDLNNDWVTPTRIGRTLKKMRLNRDRQGGSGKRGWIISLKDVMRWAQSYGLDSAAISGINALSHLSSVTSGKCVTSVTDSPRSTPQPKLNLLRGEL